MKVPLPNLDDRRWLDLVDEGRSLIPLYAPEWTDHNAHDPGITLVELFAWVAEMDIYQLNRISDEHKLKFLELVGITPQPPAAAHAVLGFTLHSGVPRQRLRTTAEFAGSDSFGKETRFRLLEPVTAAPGQIAAIQIRDAKGFRDVTKAWRDGDPFPAFGPVPEPGTELYFGFTNALRVRRPTAFYFIFADKYAGEVERERILTEVMERVSACNPPRIPCKNGPAHADSLTIVTALPPHHAVRTVWEFLTLAGTQDAWMPLDPSRKQVEDDTRSFTLDGRVVVRPPRPMLKRRIGRVESDLYYIRCRFDAGAYDAPPLIRTVVFNGALSEQATPPAFSWTVPRAVTPTGPAPAAGTLTSLLIDIDNNSQVTGLEFNADPDADPKLRVLEYTAPQAAADGTLTVEAVLIGRGNGWPSQKVTLPAAPAQQQSLQLFTQEGRELRRWDLRSSFDASDLADSHYLLDASRGEIRFGDGEHGRVPPAGALIFGKYRATRAEAGNLAANTITALVDSPHNRALIKRFDIGRNRLKSITNPVAATGGLAQETLERASARAVRKMSEVTRAVTLPDYEQLAKSTPGARIARATAIANLHHSFPCFKAIGLITVVILPDMPVARPQPSPGLRALVRSYLNRRRIIGTRVEVTGPSYLEVAVRATVKALTGVSVTTLQRRITDALNLFLHPLRGGPDSTGWPFGRDVYRSEILQVIDEIPGVDHVVSLDLVAEGCEAQCGNVCVGPTWLVVAGNHEITVV